MIQQFSYSVFHKSISDKENYTFCDSCIFFVINARNAWPPIKERILVDNKSNFKMQKVDTEPYLPTDNLSNQSDTLTEIRVKNPKSN